MAGAEEQWKVDLGLMSDASRASLIENLRESIMMDMLKIEKPAYMEKIYAPFDCPSDWLIDSGCSYHITGRGDWFTSLDETKQPTFFLGNGIAIKAKGIGTISIRTKNGTKSIDNVVLVPHVRLNVLSVGQMILSGYRVHFEDKCCKIYSKDDYVNPKLVVKMTEKREFILKMPELTFDDPYVEFTAFTETDKKGKRVRSSTVCDEKLF